MLDEEFDIVGDLVSCVGLTVAVGEMDVDGLNVGLGVKAVGLLERTSVCSLVVAIVGESEGDDDKVGDVAGILGALVGVTINDVVGLDVDSDVGVRTGSFVGESVGSVIESELGASVGSRFESMVGSMEGSVVGISLG